MLLGGEPEADTFGSFIGHALSAFNPRRDTRGVNLLVWGYWWFGFHLIKFLCDEHHYFGDELESQNSQRDNCCHHEDDDRESVEITDSQICIWGAGGS